MSPVATFGVVTLQVYKVASVWQLVPLTPVRQLQELVPLTPVRQLQVYCPSPLTHVPPFKHGFEAHSLISVPQIVPVNPFLQLHTKALITLVQLRVLLESHGLLAQL